MAQASCLGHRQWWESHHQPPEKHRRGRVEAGLQAASSGHLQAAVPLITNNCAAPGSGTPGLRWKETPSSASHLWPQDMSPSVLFFQTHQHRLS